MPLTCLGALSFTAALAPTTAAGARCPVSATTPVPGHTAFNVGTERLAVALPKGATFRAVREGHAGWAFVQDDGRIRVKLGWLSPSRAPRVVGRRLDRRARPLVVDMGVQSSASTGLFYPSLLYFPSAGCWRLTAENGVARLDFVVRVVAAQ